MTYRLLKQWTQYSDVKKRRVYTTEDVNNLMEIILQNESTVQSTTLKPDKEKKKAYQRSIENETRLNDSKQGEEEGGRSCIDHGDTSGEEIGIISNENKEKMLLPGDLNLGFPLCVSGGQKSPLVFKKDVQKRKE